MAVNILFDILGISFPRNPDRWSEIWFPVSGSKRSSRTLHGIYHTSTIDTYQLEILSVSFLLYSHLVAVSWVGIAICWKLFGWCNQLWWLKTLVNQLWCLKTYKANGGFIMSASHNPGGPENDWGIKFNYNSGQPAPESITDKIYGNSLSISEIKMADISDVDLSRLGVTNFGGFTVEVADPVSDYMELLESVFDFELIRTFITRPDFRFKFDAMHAITGAYAKPIFVDQLGANADSISNGI